MVLLLYSYFRSLATLDELNIFWHCCYSFCMVLLAFTLFDINTVSVWYVYSAWYDLTFILIFSIRHSGFNEKKTSSHSWMCIYNMTPHIFIRNSFIIYGIFGRRICYRCYRLVAGRSVVGAFGRWLVSQWSVAARWLVYWLVVGW